MPNDANGMQVRVTNMLGAYAEAWDSLVEQMPIPSPFLRSWWLDTAAGTHPCIVLVLQRGRLVGGLALEPGRHLGFERLRLLGAGRLCPDHLDAVADPGMSAEVAAALGDWLTRKGNRLVDLDGVVSNSLIAKTLPEGFRRERTAIAPWVALCGDDHARRPSSSHRFVRRAEQRLLRETGGCSFERVGDIEDALDILHRLHRQRWGDSSNFLRDFGRFATICRAAAARGELAMHVLRVDDRAIAVMASFEVAGRISCYQSGRVPERRWRTAGTVLLARVVDDAGRRGLREADLLRGDEPYKAYFADGQRPLWRLRCAVGWRAGLALQVDLAAERARHLAGRTRRWLQSTRKRLRISAQ
jgi:CelD/BcsL family acetyltransferase involved in cellulose biosynthesis